MDDLKAAVRVAKLKLPKLPLKTPKITPKWCFTYLISYLSLSAHGFFISIYLISL